MSSRPVLLAGAGPLRAPARSHDRHEGEEGLTWPTRTLRRCPTTGRRAEWRHGIALDPVRMHCWTAGPDGRPVDGPEDTGLYTVTCTPDGPGPGAHGPGRSTT